MSNKHFIKGLRRRARQQAKAIKRIEGIASLVTSHEERQKGIVRARVAQQAADRIKKESKPEIEKLVAQDKKRGQRKGKKALPRSQTV